MGCEHMGASFFFIFFYIRVYIVLEVTSYLCYAEYKALVQECVRGMRC
jgi:hypothetical protein